MRIAQIDIQNFRGIRNGTISLPEHGVFFGRNNVGKSAIAEALALLFGRERMTYGLSDWDFHGGSLTPDSRFTLVATMTGFGSGENAPERFPRWFMGKSARPVWWRQDTKTISFDD